MSFRAVRASKFRHVFGKEFKKQDVRTRPSAWNLAQCHPGITLSVSKSTLLTERGDDVKECHLFFQTPRYPRPWLPTQMLCFLVILHTACVLTTRTRRQEGTIVSILSSRWSSPPTGEIVYFCVLSHEPCW